MSTLPCGQMDIVQMAVKALKTMATGGNLKRRPPDEMYINKDERQTLYNTFEQLGDPGVPVVGASYIRVVRQYWRCLQFVEVGRAARQKRLRRQIRSCAFPTAVHITAWAECYRHWKALNEGLNKPSKDNGNGEKENNILSGSSDVRQSEALINRSYSRATGLPC